MFQSFHIPGDGLEVRLVELGIGVLIAGAHEVFVAGPEFAPYVLERLDDALERGLQCLGGVDFAVQGRL